MVGLGAMSYRLFNEWRKTATDAAMHARVTISHANVQAKTWGGGSNLLPRGVVGQKRRAVRGGMK